MRILFGLVGTCRMRTAIYLLYAGADKVVSPKQLLGIDIGHKAAMPITHRLVRHHSFDWLLRIFELRFW